MTTHKHPASSPDSASSQAPVDEREWLAQEYAARAERLGTSSALDGDGLVARYRDVSRALRQPCSAGPPPNFAEDMARRVAIESQTTADRFERIVLQVAVALLGLAMGVVSVVYGGGWTQAAVHTAPDGTLPWVGLVASCAVLHWVVERWRVRREE